MDREKITEELYARMEDKGYRCRVVSIHHLAELQKEIEELYARGLFHELFYQEALPSFNFKAPDSQVKSLIIVAAPQPKIRVGFNLEKRPFSFLIPPSYSYAVDEDVKQLIQTFLEPMGYGLVKAVLPLKLLAVRSGVAQYGKNNIAYVDGMGSFLRLRAFYTDLPCADDNWEESRVMERCEDCSACIKACPAGAISSERFLLYAERCLTYYNERNEDFPEWIDPSWHNCVVGCLVCQKNCPANRNVLNRVEGKERFSEKETAVLLKGVSKDDLGTETLQKLQRLGLLEYLELLPRNLKVLFRKEHEHPL